MSLKENCLQTVSGQTLFSSLNDVVMLYYSFKDVNMTRLETILLQRHVLWVCHGNLLFCDGPALGLATEYVAVGNMLQLKAFFDKHAHGQIEPTKQIKISALQLVTTQKSEKCYHLQKTNTSHLFRAEDNTWYSPDYASSQILICLPNEHFLGPISFISHIKATSISNRKGVCHKTTFTFPIS